MTATNPEVPTELRFGVVSRRLLAFIGVDPSRLRKPSEKVHHLTVASAVLIGPATTAAMFVFAAYFVYEASAKTTALLAAAVFIIYVAIEQGIASQATPPKVIDRLKLGGARLMLVIVVSFLVGEMVAEQYFHAEVDAAVAELRETSLDEVSDRIRDAADEQVQIDALRDDRRAARQDLERLDRRLARAEQRVDEIQALIDSEEEGELGGRESGCGAFCEAKQAELRVAITARDQIAAYVAAGRAQAERTLEEIEEHIQALEDRVDRRVDREIGDLRASPPSPAERFSGLNEATFGKGNWDRLLIRLAITLGLMLIESAAILLKLGRQSRYDAESWGDEAAETAELQLESDRRLNQVAEEREKDADDRERAQYGRRLGREVRTEGFPELLAVRKERELMEARADLLEGKIKVLKKQAEHAVELNRIVQYLREQMGWTDFGDLPFGPNISVPADDRSDDEDV